MVRNNCMALVLLGLAIATMMQVADGFIPRLSQLPGAKSVHDKVNLAGCGRLSPLNTNPRKIDVGEESIARFGKVSLTLFALLVVLASWFHKNCQAEATSVQFAFFFEL